MYIYLKTLEHFWHSHTFFLNPRICLRVPQIKKTKKTKNQKLCPIAFWMATRAFASHRAPYEWFLFSGRGRQMRVVFLGDNMHGFTCGACRWAIQFDAARSTSLDASCFLFLFSCCFLFIFYFLCLQNFFWVFYFVFNFNVNLYQQFLNTY